MFAVDTTSYLYLHSLFVNSLMSSSDYFIIASLIPPYSHLISLQVLDFGDYSGSTPNRTYVRRQRAPLLELYRDDNLSLSFSTETLIGNFAPKCDEIIKRAS